MKEMDLTDLGFKNKCYEFKNEDRDEIIRFHLVRSDLIHDFSLMTDKYVKSQFQVVFFYF